MIFNQPFDGAMGDIIIEELSNMYTHVDILSAFAKNSGVLRIQDEILLARENNTIVRAFIGVDLNNTTYEALVTLYEICDELFIVHAENPNMTFHSKIYSFRNNDGSGNVYIGSNNLTGGGLWTNFETSCKIIINNLEDARSLDSILNRYTQGQDRLTIRVDNIAFIESLRENGYITNEGNERINYDNNPRENNNEILFGNFRGIALPFLPNDGPFAPNQEKNEVIDQIPQGNDELFQEEDQIHNNVERIWFQTLAMTGGSRNILDLSKKGRLNTGNPETTLFHTEIPDEVLGGVTFFGIDPNAMLNLEISIDLNGYTYRHATIVYPNNGINPNGSWRLQLRGINENGQKLAELDFVNKILVFERIEENHYSIEIIDDNPENLQDIINRSIFTALNGSRRNSKLYGVY